MKYAYNPLWTHKEAKNRLEKVERFRPYSAIVAVDNGHYWAEDEDGKTIDEGTDASTVINAAMDSGGKIYIKKGTYTLTYPLEFSIMGTYLEGDSRDNTILSGGISSLLYSPGNIGNIGISGLWLDGVNRTGSGILTDGTYPGGTTSFMNIGDIRITNCLYAIDLKATQFSWIHDFIITGNAPDTNTNGIRIQDGCFQNVFSNFWITGITSVGLWILNTGTNSENNMFHNGTFFATTGQALQGRLENGWTTIFDAVTWDNSPTTNMQIIGGQDTIFQNCLFLGVAADCRGIYAESKNPGTIIKGLYIDKCQFENCGSAGIHISSGALGAVENLSIDSCYFTNNGDAAGWALSDIFIDAVDGSHIQNNECISPGTTQSLSLNNNCVGLQIQFNNFVNGASVPYPNDYLIWMNKGFNPQPVRNQAVGASPYTYTNTTGQVETVYVQGGSSITAITIRTYAMPVVTLSTVMKTFTLYPGDALTIAYTAAAPTMTIQPM